MMKNLRLLAEDAAKAESFDPIAWSLELGAES